jgi:hypothetical protein
VPTSGRDSSTSGKRPTRLTCLVCGRVVPFTEEELLDYIQNGWPLCCGEAMTIARNTGPDEDTPAPTVGLP